MHDSTLSAPILIVDDDDTQRGLTRMLLDAAGVRLPLVECLGGPQAIAYLTACLREGGTFPAAVFLDLAMPTIDGIGVLQWVRAHPPLDSLRIIVLTSSTSAADREICADLGANAYLVKHPLPDVLLHTLARVGLSESHLVPPQLKSA